MMLGIRSTIIVLWLAGVTALPARSAAEKCELQGSVSDAATGESLRKATVELAPWSGSAPNRQTTTDSAGRFAFTAIPPGEYWLHGERAGYLEASLGARSSDTKGTLLRVKAGDAVSDLHLKLTRMSVISGKVTDGAGDPVGGASVTAYLATWLRGHREFDQHGQGRANEAGEFRISGLAAGRYYLYVSPDQDPYFEEQGKPEKRLLAAFYPNAQTLDSAVLVQVAAGESTADINFRVRAVETFAVRGRMASRPKDGTELNVIASRAGLGAKNWPAGQTMAQPDGTFAISGLPIGAYQLRSIITGPAGAYGGGTLPIEIKTGDLSGVVVPVSMPLEISGTLHFGGAAMRIVGDAINLLEADTGATPNLFVAVKADGTFRAKVAPGRYVVSLPLVPGDDYLKSISYGGGDVLGQVVDFSQGILGEFEISVAKGAGRVEGSVSLSAEDDSSAAKETMLGAQVALVSDRVRFDTDALFLGEVDQTGHFSFNRVPPGKYYVFATQDVDAGLWENRDFVEQIRGSGIEVNVAENGRVHIEAPLIALGEVERALAAIGQ